MLNHKKILMFGYIYLFNNNIKYLKKYITSNKNGKILYIKFERQNLGPIRDDVSASYDLSSHDLSIFVYLFNKLPKIIKTFFFLSKVSKYFLTTSAAKGL